MTPSSRRTAAICLLVIAAFAAACWFPTRRLREEERQILLVPVFFLTLAVLHVVAKRRPATFRDDMPDPSCARCGYSLRGHTMPAARCPECGSDLLPQDIIVGKDIWHTCSRKHLRRWALLFLVLVLASPLYVPGVQRREKMLDCAVPASFNQLRSSKRFFRMQFILADIRWSFLYGPSIPHTQRRAMARFVIWSHTRGFQELDVDPADRQYSYRMQGRGRVIVPG